MLHTALALLLAYPVPKLPPGTLGSWNMIGRGGQSLAGGTAGNPPINTSQPYSNTRGKSVLPFPALIETSLETPVSASLNNLRFLAGPSRDYVGDLRFLAGCSAACLGPGTSTYLQMYGPTGDIYAANHAHHVWYIGTAFTHGETDHVLGTSRSDYANFIVLYQQATEYDAQTRTSTTLPAPLFISQMNSWTAGGRQAYESDIPLAQLDATEIADNRVFLTHPKYMLPYVTGGVHLTNAGYQRSGEYDGYVMKLVLKDGVSWRALYPKMITASYNVISLVYNVNDGTGPIGPVVLDTTLLANTYNDFYGFQIEHAPGDIQPVYITNVAVVGPDTIKLTLSGPPHDGDEVSYALWGLPGAGNGSPGTGLVWGGPRGNVHDSTSTLSISNATLYQWGATFKKAITSGTTLPPAAIAALFEDIGGWAFAWIADTRLAASGGCPDPSGTWVAQIGSPNGDMPWQSGTHSCNASVPAGINSASFGTTRMNGALLNTNGCWHQSGTGHTEFSFPAHQDILIRAVAKFTRPTTGSTYVFHWQADAGASAGQVRLLILPNGNISALVQLAPQGALTVALAAGIPGTPQEGMIDLRIGKRGAPNSGNCVVELCYNGICAKGTGTAECGQPAAGIMSISGSTTCTQPPNYQITGLLISAGEQARLWTKEKSAALWLQACNTPPCT